MLGNTLAASFIWGINTIFLLDAGLSNAEAFAANAFFTAGMVLFEVPTGIVADTIGRRVSYLLGTADPDRLDGALRAAVAGRGAVLGVGGVVDAARARVHLLLRRGRGLARRRPRRHRLRRRARGRLRPRARSSPGSRCSTGSVAGGLIAQATSLGVPFVVRAGVLLVMFVVAFRLMHDVGFTPAKGQRPLAEMRRITADSIEYGWRVPAVKWLMLELAVQRRGRDLRLLRPAAVPARALRRPDRLLGRRPGGGDRRRRPDPRRDRRAADPPALSPPHLGADRDVGARRRRPGADRRDRELRGGDRADRRLGPAVRGRDADPPGLHQRDDPLEAAGDDPLLRLADELHRRRLGPAGPRALGRRLGLRALVPAQRRDRGAGAAVHLALAPRARSRRHGRRCQAAPEPGGSALRPGERQAATATAVGDC